MTAALKPGERDFLQLVQQAAAVNPFSEERLRVDAAIAGGEVSDASPGASLETAIRKVDTFLEELRQNNRYLVRRYSAEDRPMIENAHLFEVFHRFLERFDALIVKQTRTGDGTCPVPFARDVITDIVSRGFTEEEALRYFALFYQLRRAFFFIRSSLVGTCDSMRRLRCDLWANVFTMDLGTYTRFLWNRMEDFSTLLLGETGSGKGAAAAAIGRSGFIPYDAKRDCFSESFVKSFVPINLSQYAETLLESELFGHRKGAFTGAVEAHEGVFARCSSHGAIFLDEIGDVSVPTQIKLLKVLQERTFCPVGSHETCRFRGRVIAASNRSITALRERGAFRDDFYYRLCSDAITVPPLRQRIAENAGELGLLVELISSRILAETAAGTVDMINETIVRDLGEDYDWPGNVRELEQRIRQVLLRRECSPDPRHPAGGQTDILADGIAEGALSVPQLVAAYCARLYAELGTYEAVAKRTGLDRRTAKKYILEAATEDDGGAPPP